MPYPWDLMGYDQFSGVDLTPLEGRLLTDGDGREWHMITGSAVIQGGRARIAGTQPQRTVAVMQMGVYPQRANMAVSLSAGHADSNHVALVARMSADGRTYYKAYLDKPNVHIFKVVDGTSTWLGVVSLESMSPNYSFTFACFNDKLRIIKFGGVGPTVELEITDGSALNAGYFGFEISEPGQYLDDVYFWVEPGGLTSIPPTTVPPTTAAPTTAAPTTVSPTTTAPTTPPEPTFPPTTLAPTTAAPTTVAPTTPAPTTPAPTTIAPTTVAPLLTGDLIRADVAYVSEQDQLVVRAWVTNEFGRTRDVDLDPALCTLELIDELGVVRLVGAVADPMDSTVRFVVPAARLYSEHLYLLRITLDDAGPRLIPMPVT